MTIKEVSEKYGLSQATIRYYESIGIIPYCNRKNGIRDFQQKDLNAIEFVLCLRRAGLPIESIQRYIRLTEEGDSTFSERIQILEHERDELIKRRSEIDSFIDHLDHKIEYFKSKEAK